MSRIIGRFAKIGVGGAAAAFMWSMRNNSDAATKIIQGEDINLNIDDGNLIGGGGDNSAPSPRKRPAARGGGVEGQGPNPSHVSGSTVRPGKSVHFPENWVKWDSNWDRRDPASLIKPRKRRKSKDRATDEGGLGGAKIGDDNNVDLDASTTTREELEKHTPKTSRHVFLIRHGDYRIDGKTDEERRITELGRSQASLTGVRLRELNLPYKVLVRSTMARAVETAELIEKELKRDSGYESIQVRDTDMLREGPPVPPEPPVEYWTPGEHEFFSDGARIEAAFRRYIHRADPGQEQDSYEVLVCHGNVIRYFVCRALQFPPQAWLRLNVLHGSVTWITIRPSGRVVLQSLGDAGHMPPDKLSGSPSADAVARRDQQQQQQEKESQQQQHQKEKNKDQQSWSSSSHNKKR